MCRNCFVHFCVFFYHQLSESRWADNEFSLQWCPPLNVVEVATAAVVVLSTTDPAAPSSPLVCLAGERNLISRSPSEKVLLLNQSPHALTVSFGNWQESGWRAEGIALRRREAKGDVSHHPSMYIRKSWGLTLKIIPFASFPRPP